MPNYNAFWLIDVKSISTTQSEGQITEGQEGGIQSLWEDPDLHSPLTCQGQKGASHPFWVFPEYVTKDAGVWYGMSECRRSWSGQHISALYPANPLCICRSFKTWVLKQRLAATISSRREHLHPISSAVLRPRKRPKRHIFVDTGEGGVFIGLNLLMLAWF